MASKKKASADKAWERRYEAELRRAKRSAAWRSQSELIAARKKHLNMRGLAGTPEEHAAAFNRAIHAARKPLSFGCTTAQRSFGTAIAHYESAPSMRRHEALLEAERILDQMCLCKRG